MTEGSISQMSNEVTVNCVLLRSQTYSCEVGAGLGFGDLVTVEEDCFSVCGIKQDKVRKLDPLSTVKVDTPL